MSQQTKILLVSDLPDHKQEKMGYEDVLNSLNYLEAETSIPYLKGALVALRRQITDTEKKIPEDPDVKQSITIAELGILTGDRRK